MEQQQNDQAGPLPCPCCGSAAELIQHHSQKPDKFRIRCSGCPLEISWYSTREQVLAQWNLRATSAQTADWKEAYSAGFEAAKALFSQMAAAPAGWLHVRELDLGQTQKALSFQEAAPWSDPREDRPGTCAPVFLAPAIQNPQDVVDAARYRFLRDGAWNSHTHPEIKEYLLTHVNRRALDETLDAARAAAGAPPVTVFDPQKPRVEEIAPAYQEGKLNPDYVGRWKCIPLAFGDGTAIVQEGSHRLLLQFSDYQTAQVLVHAHNASMDSAANSARAAKSVMPDKAQVVALAVQAGFKEYSEGLLCARDHTGATCCTAQVHAFADALLAPIKGTAHR
jgi:hypothetical protein